MSKRASLAPTGGGHTCGHRKYGHNRTFIARYNVGFTHELHTLSRCRLELVKVLRKVGTQLLSRNHPNHLVVDVDHRQVANPHGTAQPKDTDERSVFSD